jgi:hypothetical protein
MESNNTNITSLTISNNSLLDKLKPSARNRLISKKYNISCETSNLNKLNNSSNYNNNMVSEYIYSQIEQKNPGPDTIQTPDETISNSTFNEQWNKIVQERKMEALHLDLSASGNFPSLIKASDECSILSENLENLNNFIEEKYQMNLTENIFIRNPDNYHSIFPFILITSREIHRATLSDYEIKLVYKSFKNKIKEKRIDGFDYYRIGLIYFFQGKFLKSYLYFKNAYNLRKEVSIAKWLAFNILIIIFCYKNYKNYKNCKNPDDIEEENNFDNENSEISEPKISSILKINFTQIKNVKLSPLVEENDEKDSFFFGCCSRKKKSNFNNESTNIFIKHDYLLNFIKSKNENSIFYNSSIEILNKSTLCKDVVTLLEESLNASEEKKEQNLIELLWLITLISIYIQHHPDQKVFPSKISHLNIEDPKLLIKTIKEKDLYFGYLLYAEHKYLLDSKYNMKAVLTELIIKYPNKNEAYLRLWTFLVKGEFKDYKLANQLSEVLWKNSSTIRLDSNLYYLYVVITHAKSLYYLGNNFYTITYFQKEYPANFLYPSIYYLFGKYSSKSNYKNLKSVALSSLFEVYPLLFEDLQKNCLFWIGNVYFNTGIYDMAYKFWKLYLDGDNENLQINQSKLEKINNFKKNYSLLGNSLMEFKKNLKFVKNLETNKKTEKTERLKDFITDLQAIKELQPNIRENFSYFYEYQRGLIHLYIENDFEGALKIFMNVINSSKLFMKAYFQIWKILKKTSEYKVLLNFSYFMIRQSHNDEVNNHEWVKSYILYSKALFLNNRHEEAIQLLLNVLDIFAHIPLDEIKFLKEINKCNKIFTTNNFINFDYVLSFYSKYHVYKKSEAIFHFNFKCKSGKEKFLIDELGSEFNSNFSNRKKIVKSFLNRSSTLVTETISKNKTNSIFILNPLIDPLNPINQPSINEDLQQTIYLEENLSDEEKIKSNNLYYLLDSKIADVNINSVEKLEDYIEKQIEKIEIAEEYTCKIIFYLVITIISNPILMYEIGKFCAKSGLKSDMGLYCLNDYICILKFQNNFVLDEINLLKKYKAYFYMARIYCFQNDYK